MNWNVLKSIFGRDFVSYFSSTTGYVFICVFVVLSALATFWPPEFFSNNLANLDALSERLPFIMLVFIPAITMSIWAEERRQGTDELLLTVPASDLDVVLGKYLSGVAIFTVSLVFSALSIFLMFKYGLGDPDPGLFVSTYVGYWFIGVAMIAIGMVASFLTDNLTVGFILGTLFNLPLALFGVAEWIIPNPAVAQTLRQWSALEKFQDFERGLVTLGGATYFLMLAVVMLYVCMVLIGKRHWQARDEGNSLLGHFLVRTLALLAVAVGVTEFVQTRSWLRADVSSEQLSSLSEKTLELIGELRNDDNVSSISIEAFLSPQIPSDYSATKRNLLLTLAELQALGGGKIRVIKNEIETYGPDAVRAENTFGITPREVYVDEGGEQTQEEFFMGVAFTSGPAKVVIPFIDRGIPVEYELVRSIHTVLKAERLKIGIVDTGIPQLNPSSNREEEWPLISELRKQYDIDDRPVDPSQAIKDNYDVLLAVQPSMLGPQEMDHLVDAVKRGLPIAIFEDPIPQAYPPNIAGTGEPKRSQMSMFGGPPSEPKGDINQLWKALGLKMDPMAIVWQDHMPESAVAPFADEQWIFVDHDNGATEPFNEDDEISSGLNQLLFLYPGYLTKDEDSKLSFDRLAVTGSKNSGTVDTPMLRRGRTNRGVFNRQVTSNSYIVAARVTGTYVDDDLALSGDLLEGLMDAPGGEAESPATSAQTEEEEEEEEAAANEEEDSADSTPADQDEEGVEINAVVVADIDCIIPDFFVLREQGDETIVPATQNVTFVLNIIDALAGDDRFLDIRKRVRKHRTLAKIDEATEKHRKSSFEEREEFISEFESKKREAEEGFQEEISKIQNNENLTDQEKRVREEIVRRREQQKLDAKLQSFVSERSRRLKQVDFKLKQEIRAVQNKYKMLALLVPPIPPLLVAFYVFFRRREAEREGVAQTRLR